MGRGAEHMLAFLKMMTFSPKIIRERGRIDGKKRDFYKM